MAALGRHFYFWPRLKPLAERKSRTGVESIRQGKLGRSGAAPGTSLVFGRAERRSQANAKRTSDSGLAGRNDRAGL